VNIILDLGLIFLIGLFFARFIHKLHFPAVTAYLLLGIFIGPSIFNLISPGIIQASGLISNIALGFIAFTIGQNFSASNFRKIGRSVFWISIFEAGGAWILVTLTFYLLLRQPFYISLLFGSIAAATAPAATVMVVREYKTKGVFTDTLLGVVAIDDAWCLIIFALSFAIARAIHFHLSGNFFLIKVILKALLETGGAFILGGAVAFLASKVSKFLRTPTELLIYTLGFICLNIGLAIAFHLSVLLSCMFLGMTLVNLSKSNFQFFDILKSIDSPLYLIFFVLAGANLEINLLADIGILGVVYLILRVAGKMSGAALGATIARTNKEIRRFLGLALIPQAGVALGCALIVKANFPDIGGMIFTTLVATTVVYELVGPVCTKLALKKAGEI